MRLLNTTDLHFEEFYDTKLVEYTILSHCWSQDKAQPEITYQDFITCKPCSRRKTPGWEKIVRCCELSRQRGFQWTWIDTCCIDKSSSAELSEAINSMFMWYHDSAECYVFLDDCAAASLPRVAKFDINDCWQKDLRAEEVLDVFALAESRWFTRGWTLQELLAPRCVLLFNSANVLLGSKVELASLLSHASGIDENYITGRSPIKDACVAVRMSWAACRVTTRIEDVAYSLLGIFQINMPLLYGEGERAFQRLQHEIIRSSADQSIFAWGVNVDQHEPCSILADGPHRFEGCGKAVVERSWKTDIESYSITNAGLTIQHVGPHVTLSHVRLRLMVSSGTHQAIVLHMRKFDHGNWYRTMVTGRTELDRFHSLHAWKLGWMASTPSSLNAVVGRSFLPSGAMLVSEATLMVNKLRLTDRVYLVAVIVALLLRTIATSRRAQSILSELNLHVLPRHDRARGSNGSPEIRITYKTLPQQALDEQRAYHRYRSTNSRDLLIQDDGLRRILAHLQSELIGIQTGRRHGHSQHADDKTDVPDAMMKLCIQNDRSFADTAAAQLALVEQLRVRLDTQGSRVIG